MTTEESVLFLIIEGEAMTVLCPKCRSAQIRPKHTAQNICTATGVIAGITGGVYSALKGARAGSIIASPSGPVGSICGAVVGGLAGALSCGSIAMKLGEQIDQSLLQSYNCLSCNHDFCFSDTSDSDKTVGG